MQVAQFVSAYACTCCWDGFQEISNSQESGRAFSSEASLLSPSAVVAGSSKTDIPRLVEPSGTIQNEESAIDDEEGSSDLDDSDGVVCLAQDDWFPDDMEPWKENVRTLELRGTQAFVSDRIRSLVLPIVTLRSVLLVLRLRQTCQYEEIVAFFEKQARTLQSVELRLYPDLSSRDDVGAQGLIEMRNCVIPAIYSIANLESLVLGTSNLCIPFQLFDALGPIFTKLRYLTLSCYFAGILVDNIEISAPMLETFEFLEMSDSEHEGSLSLCPPINKLTRVKINCARSVHLPLPSIELLELCGVASFEGDVSHVSVMTLACCECVPEIIALCGFSLRELHISDIRSPPQNKPIHIAMESIQILFLSEVVLCEVVSTESRPLELLTLTGVVLANQQGPLFAKRVYADNGFKVDQSNQSELRSIVSHLDPKSLTHLAVDFGSDCLVEQEIMKILPRAADLVLLALTCPLSCSLATFSKLRYLALPSPADFERVEYSCISEIAILDVAILEDDLAVTELQGRYAGKVRCASQFHCGADFPFRSLCQRFFSDHHELTRS